MDLTGGQRLIDFEANDVPASVSLLGTCHSVFSFVWMKSARRKVLSAVCQAARFLWHFLTLKIMADLFS